jgi:hypothetical protein
MKELIDKKNTIPIYLLTYVIGEFVNLGRARVII